MTVSSQSPALVRFGIFEADLRAGELRRSGVRVKIQDLPFRALQLLLNHPNEVVTREVFRQALWPEGVFVDFDRAISSAIKRLRDALGDSAENPIFIETLERRGYRWIAPLSFVPNGTSPAADTETVPAPPGAASPAEDEQQSPPERYDFRKWIPVYFLLALLLVAGGWILRRAWLKKSANPVSRQHVTLHPANQEARDLYLQGRYYWNKRTPADLNKALDFFTQAIVHDPSFAEAYVGLADCYNLLREYSAMPSSEAYPRALAAAKKAVELDDHSSAAHASLAFASFWGNWDFATADREFRRSLELDPNNATAHHWYGNYLEVAGHFPQALAQIERARALDPSSRAIMADKGCLLMDSGQQNEALSLLQQMERAEPQFLSPHRYLARLYAERADYRSYLLELKKDATLSNDESALRVADAAEKGFAAGGSPVMFESIRREQLNLFSKGKLSAYLLARTCAFAGDKADALKYLQTAYDQHDEYLIALGVDRAFKSLSEDPDFRRIATAVGLADLRPAPPNLASR